MINEKDYKNLDAWKASIELAKRVYGFVALFPQDEKFSLSSQLKRAAVSVPSNIAEGMGRNSINETKHFFYIAKGSVYEIETQVYLAVELGLVTVEEARLVHEQVTVARKLIIGFIKYLDKEAKL